MAQDYKFTIYMYIGSPCLVFLFRLLSLRNHEAMVFRRGGGGICEERYFVTSYVCKYLKVSSKTVPSNRTEILVTENIAKMGDFPMYTDVA